MRTKLNNSVTFFSSQTKQGSKQFVLDAQARLSFSDNISKVLATSLDAETILNSLAQLAVPLFADWCVVFAKEEDGRVRRLKTGYGDPSKATLAREFEEYLASPEVETRVSQRMQQSLRNPKAKLTRLIDDEWIKSASRDEEDLRLMRKLNPKSHIVVPLISNRKVLGLVSLFRLNSSPPFSFADLSLAKELARRTSIAISNARIHQDLQSEIFERELSERRLRTQYKVTLTLAESKSLDDAMPIIIKTICQGLKWDWGAYWLVDEQSRRLSLQCSYNSEKVTSKQFARVAKSLNLTRGKGLVGRSWALSKEEWITDSSKEDYTPIRKAAREAGFHSGIAFPVVADKRVVGVIELQGRLIKEADTKRSSLLNAISLQIGQFIERIELEQRKDEYISIASHELKTPITSIKAFVQIIMSRIEKNGDKQNSQMLSKVNDQIDRLTLLVKDLLDVSKIQSGKLQLRTERFDIDELIYQLISDYQPLHPSHKLVVQGKSCSKIVADKDRIIQAIANLLENAIKYSPKAKKVIVDLTCEKQSAVIAVRDFGIGIEKKDQKRIFDRFYRAEDFGHTFQGQGLGLYITSEIVKRHGGVISVKSQKGKGSEFTIQLPLKLT